MSNFWRNCAFGCAGLVVLLAIAVVGGAVWLRTELTAKPPPGPRLAPNTVFRPVFQMQNGKVFSAGTAFALRLRTDGMPLAVTALHLFGPSGGLDKDIPASELSRAVREVLLVPIGRNAPVARAARAMTSTGRPVGDDGDVSGDVAAFLIPRPGRIPVLQPAGDNPRMGEWIWLVGDAVNHKPQSQRLFPARAITVSQKGLTLRFHKSFPLQAFSGAPLLNRQGEVVGILIGGEEQSQLAIANPITRMKEHLPR